MFIPVEYKIFSFHHGKLVVNSFIFAFPKQEIGQKTITCDSETETR